MRTLFTSMVALALLVQNGAYAASCTPTACSGQISILDIEANGDAYVGLFDGLAGLTGCTPNAGAEQLFTLSASSPNWALVYNTLLEAQVHGYTVTIAAVANSSGCTIRYVMVGVAQ